MALPRADGEELRRPQFAAGTSGIDISRLAEPALLAEVQQVVQYFSRVTRNIMSTWGQRPIGS